MSGAQNYPAGYTSHQFTPAMRIGKQNLCDVRASIKIRHKTVYAEQPDARFFLNTFAAPSIAQKQPVC